MDIEQNIRRGRHKRERYDHSASQNSINGLNPCSENGCGCQEFTETKIRRRNCQTCNHSWLKHYLEGITKNDSLSVSEVCSLVLYGTHALPIRLKILIERLLSYMDEKEIEEILAKWGWTMIDLARGYMLQDEDGFPLCHWSILPREEEILILEQFLRFHLTHSLTIALLNEEKMNSWEHKDFSIGFQQCQSSTNDEVEENLVLNLSSVGVSVASSSDSHLEEELDECVFDEEYEDEEAVDLTQKNSDKKSNNIKTNQLNPPFWNPVVTTLPNGKRRVECAVCLKTFCDKGALKIHFSAVHLREMHKCTVNGCSMMFSSRRSRNRHSANPNPKLHAPNLRRKISPTDGRISQGLNNIQIIQSIPSDGNFQGARKRKLQNPIKVPMDEAIPSIQSSQPLSPSSSSANPSTFGSPQSSNSESNPNSPTLYFNGNLNGNSNNSDGTTSIHPLQSLAAKVFNFSNHFENVHIGNNFSVPSALHFFLEGGNSIGGKQFGSNFGDRMESS